MMKRGVRVVRAPRATEAPPTEGPEVREISYLVGVSFVLPDGTTSAFNGSFLARDASRAEEQARAFVLRYLRPQQIIGAVVAPA